MIPNNYPTGITIVNIILIVISIWLCSYCYRKCFIYRLNNKDHQFYSLKLQKCVTFFIFNSVALYVNYRMFYTLELQLSKDLVFLRFVDRGVVLIYAFYKILDVTKYYPTAYDNKKATG